jgi:putative peptidoglycan lipid II flippase
MATADVSLPGRKSPDAPVMLGGFAALAEAAWMGFPQAADVLEPIGIATARLRSVVPRLPTVRLSGLLTREFTIAEATFLFMASFFFSALLGGIRQILFNAQFGVGAEANAYYAAFRLPDLFFSLIAGGALSSAMIPVLISTSRGEGVERGWRLTSLVLTALLATFAAIILIAELVLPAFVNGVLAPGFDPETSQLTISLTRIMLVQPLILAVSSVATAVLNSRNQFLLTALSIASHNVTLILGILAARIIPGLGILGPTFGVVGGAVLQVLILLPGLTGNNFRYQPLFDPNDARLREVIRLLIPNGLAVGILYAGSIADTSFASLAPEKASLPAINSAWLMVGLPIALFGQAVGQSAFPRLAAAADAADWGKLGGTLLRALGSVVVLSIPAVGFLVLLGRACIRVLFEHGRFDAAAGTLTYEVLVAYSVALPAYVATEVISRGLIALRDTRTPLMTNTLQIAGRIALMAALVGQVGVLAIPVALAVAATAETVILGVVLWVTLRRRRNLVLAPA